VDKIGQRLLKEKVITNKQLKEALERQRLHGGRLGHNLVTLGLITLEEFNTFIESRPTMPKTVEDTGLELSFIADLILKHTLFMGEFKLTDIIENIKLPLSIVDPAIDILRHEKFVEVKGATEYARISYTFSITGEGKKRAKELFETCQYVGAAPVPLYQYKTTAELQTTKNIIVSEDSVREAFSRLIISERLLKRLGPAISSGKAMFIYGPPGNGKTTIAETLGKIFPGTVYIPYSIVVGGQIITIFDPVSHIPAKAEKEAYPTDPRWVLIKRPVIITGGELTLKALELDFNSISKFYEASLQMKANNGLFIVDDFGRQQVEPHHLLNRWIVPLERGVDYMTLHTGMKFDIPFDQIVIFSTNIDPGKLVDEAFLRRIRYKIKIDHPTVEEYEAIFKRVCESNAIEFKTDVFDYLITNYYKKLSLKLNACHPRDIVDQIIDDAYYYHRAPQLTKDTVDNAWAGYFVEI
jgi:predicted ATPase with chaperone activity